MTRDTLSDILALQYRLYQTLELRDIYKLLYQRVFGPEHSVDHLRAARERLYLEAIQLPDTSASIPMLEPLSSVLCRINLQPFTQAGGDLAWLWQVLRRTVCNFRPGVQAALQHDWSHFRNTSWAQRYAPELLEQFWQRMATADFPPVHHSRHYTEAHAPHYRVVCRSLAEAVLA